jgi:hypothetical protein
MTDPEAQALLRIARRDLKAAEVLQIPSTDESSWRYIGGRAYLIVAVQPVFAADKAEALDAGIELFPGHRVTVVLKEGEPGS